MALEYAQNCWKSTPLVISTSNKSICRLHFFHDLLYRYEFSAYDFAKRYFKVWLQNF